MKKNTYVGNYITTPLNGHPVDVDSCCSPKEIFLYFLVNADSGHFFLSEYIPYLIPIQLGLYGHFLFCSKSLNSY